MTEHYNCGGALTEGTEPDAYVCEKCGATVRASVVDRQERFQRVAGRDSRLGEIATAALEGSDE